MKRSVHDFHSKIVSLIHMDHDRFCVGFWGGYIAICDKNMSVLQEWNAHRQAVRALVYTSKKVIISGSYDEYVKAWDRETHAELWSIYCNAEIFSIDELDDSSLVIGGENSITILDSNTGNKIKTVHRTHTDWVYTVIALGKDKTFASGSFDGTIKVWSLDHVHSIDVGRDVFKLSLSPCHRYVAAACGGGILQTYRLPHWDRIWEFDIVNNAVTSEPYSVAWSPDGRLIAVTTGSHQTVTILSSFTGDMVKTLANTSYWNRATIFSLDGTKLIFTDQSDTSLCIERLYHDLQVQLASIAYKSTSCLLQTIFSRCQKYFLA